MEAKTGKILLITLGALLITGCSSNDKKLCNKIEEINVNNYIEEENYDELVQILGNYQNTYCENSTSDICNSLKNYIENVKEDVELKDCTNLGTQEKQLCESNNQFKISGKKTKVTYEHEELWAVCNE